MDEALVALRRVLSAERTHARDDLLRRLAQELGFQRLGLRLREGLESVLTIAGRRSIVETTAGEVHLRFRSLHDTPRPTQKAAFLTALGRAWVSRDKAMILAARHLGFGRVSPEMRAQYASLINGLLREGRLEASDDSIRRL